MPMMIRPDGTIVVEAIDTMVGKGVFLTPGMSTERQAMVVIDVSGKELGTGNPGSVTLLLPADRARDWTQRIAAIIEAAGL
jgi:hypothetical protein